MIADKLKEGTSFHRTLDDIRDSVETCDSFPYQRQERARFAGNKILIDSTHGTNQYDFQITTLASVETLRAFANIHRVTITVHREGGFQPDGGGSTRQLAVCYRLRMADDGVMWNHYDSVLP